MFISLPLHHAQSRQPDSGACWWRSSALEREREDEQERGEKAAPKRARKIEEARGREYIGFPHTLYVPLHACARVCVCVCVCVSAIIRQTGATLAATPAERRMTHLPRGTESLHHHQVLLAVEQMRFHSCPPPQPGALCLPWKAGPRKSVGVRCLLYPEKYPALLLLYGFVLPNVQPG